MKSRTHATYLMLFVEHLNGLYRSFIFAKYRNGSVDGATANKMLCSSAIGNTG